MFKSILVITSLIFGVATCSFAQQTRPNSDSPSATRPTDTPAPPPPPQRPNPRNFANFVVPEDIEVVREVIYSTVEGKDGKPIDLKMDCAFLKESDGEPMPVVMYIHGGGWSGGDRAVGLPFCVAIAHGGYFACTVSYRLTDEAIFPAQIHDVKAAVRFIRSNAEKLAIDPNRIGVWGHSAGGHLSALLGVTGPPHSTLDGPVGDRPHSSQVHAVVDISGPTDLLRIAPGGSGGPAVSGLLGGPVREKLELAKQASPVTHVDATDAPTLIIQGGQDRLVVDEQAEVLRDALKNAGVEVEYLYIEEAGHGVHDQRAFEATAKFFDKHLRGHASEALVELLERYPALAGGRRPQPGLRMGAGGPPQRPMRTPDAESPQSQPMRDQE